MKWLVIDNAADAVALSELEAKERGCGRNPGDITRRWWDVEDSGAKALICVSDDDAVTLQQKGRITPIGLIVEDATLRQIGKAEDNKPPSAR